MEDVAARIELLIGRVWSHSKDPVFALQPHLDASGEVFRDKSRYADAQVHMKPVPEFLRRASRDPVTHVKGSRLAFPLAL